MTRHVLDSDVVIDALRRVDETLALLASLWQQGDILCSCDVVLAEVYTGLAPAEHSRAERFLTTLEYLPSSASAARQAGMWRSSYARQGRQFSTTDCLIAAIAADHQADVITGNLKDFPMVLTLALPKPSNGGAR